MNDFKIFADSLGTIINTTQQVTVVLKLYTNSNNWFGLHEPINTLIRFTTYIIDSSDSTRHLIGKEHTLE